LLGTLAAVVVGHYIAVPLLAFAEGPLRRQAAGDVATAVAVTLVGCLWWGPRQGRAVSVTIVTKAVGLAAASLAITLLWPFVSALTGGAHRDAFAFSFAPIGWPSSFLADRGISGAVWKPIWFLTALGYCLSAIGTGEALAHVAPELRQPRIRQLEWTARA